MKQFLTLTELNKEIEHYESLVLEIAHTMNGKPDKTKNSRKSDFVKDVHNKNTYIQELEDYNKALVKLCTLQQRRYNLEKRG